MDFEAWLTLATLITGLLWALDKWYLSKRRTADEKPNWIVELGRSFFSVLLIVLVVRSFMFEPFRIPSRSMVPTLKVGDFILVNKASYGLRLPVIHTKIIPIGEPKRGDVVVFRFPEQPKIDYIKRIIGLPGDHIAYYGEQLYINGEPVPAEHWQPYTDEKIPRHGIAKTAVETLPGGKRHPIIDIIERGSPQQREITVPKGHYFVMGDNRDNSSDSRVWGFVPEQNLVGKAFATWFSADFQDFKVRWQRIARPIH